MNDNQYIAHSAIVYHSGVKGMKWGKHLKAAIDNYKEFNQLDEFSSQKVGQSNSAYDAYTKAKQEYYSRAKRNGDPKNNYDRQQDAQRLQGSYNAYKRAKAEEASAIKKLRTVYPSKISTPTIFGQQFNLPAIGKGVKADISDAYNSAKDSVSNGYKVAKTKTGQVFGKAKTFFGKPTLSRVVKKNGKKK